VAELGNGIIIPAEEHHGFAKLEVVVYLFVARAIHLQYKLVERVVITLAGTQRKPCVATLHQPVDAHRLRLSAIGFALGLILQPEQQPLLLQGLYG